MNADEVERSQTEEVMAHVGDRYMVWSADPLGNRLFWEDNKFMASVNGYDCLITVEFQDPR